MSNSVVAVVDRDASAVIVWWVDVGPRPVGMSRMCGAWVLDEADCVSTVADLTASRAVATTAAGRSFLDGNGIATPRSVDVVATRAGVAAARDHLQAAYDEAVWTRKNGRSLIAPSWPDLPAELDVEQTRAVADDPRTSRALGIARWFGDLCAAWDGIEEQRLARAYMREVGGPAGRVLPVLCASGEETSAA